MGNHKLSFSGIMPNSWYYKLRGMNRTRKHPHSFGSPKKKQSAESSASRNLHGYSYFTASKPDRLRVSAINKNAFDGQFPNAALRKTSIIKRTRKTIYKPSHKLKFLSRNKTQNSVSDVNFTFGSPWNSFDDHESPSSSLSSEIVLHNHYRRKKIREVNQRLESIPEVDEFPEPEEETSVISPRKPVSVGRNSNAKSKSAGIRLRVNSPKLARGKKKASVRKSGSSSSARMTSAIRKNGISDSFAIVMTSADPQKEFSESMKEMITENNLKETEDLEELLACYLSLNASEYHEIIIKAFEHIWFDLH